MKNVKIKNIKINIKKTCRQCHLPLHLSYQYQLYRQTGDLPSIGQISTMEHEAIISVKDGALLIVHPQATSHSPKLCIMQMNLEVLNLTLHVISHKYHMCPMQQKGQKWHGKSPKSPKTCDGSQSSVFIISNKASSIQNYCCGAVFQHFHHSKIFGVNNHLIRIFSFKLSPVL